MKNDKKTLFLTIKRYWFDKILSGEKTIEYCEYKDYYHKKFCNTNYTEIILQAGYSKSVPRLKADILKIDVNEVVFDTDLFSGKMEVYEIHIANPKLIPNA